MPYTKAKPSHKWLTLEVLVYIGAWPCQRAFFVETCHFVWFLTLRHAHSLDKIRYYFHVTMVTLRSGDLFWSHDVWWVIHFSLVLDLEILILKYSSLINDGFLRWQFIPDIYFPEVILDGVWSFYIFTYVGLWFSHPWLILEVFVLFEAHPFWEVVFILGHSHLDDFLHWD